MFVVLREPLQNLPGAPDPAVANPAASGNPATNPDSGFGSRPAKPADVGAPDPAVANPAASGNPATNPDSGV
jgi:hypothetical protein